MNKVFGYVLKKVMGTAMIGVLNDARTFILAEYPEELARVPPEACPEGLSQEEESHLIFENICV